MGRSIRIKNNGFTLVELSIVLVIIGLLIGGILVGQSLIESARINAQVRQFQQYDIALRNFYGKFKQIPGDSTVVADPTTFDIIGLGNGLLNDYVGNTPIFRVRGESYDYFIHLSQNGFLTEEYIYRAGGAAYYFAGEGYPFPSPIINKDGTRAIVMNSNKAGQLFYLFYNAPIPGSNPWLGTGTGSLKPTQALALDNKLDDGAPSTGDVVVVQNTWDNSASAYYPMPLETAGNCVASAAYIVTSTDDTACTLLVKIQSYK